MLTGLGELFGKTIAIGPEIWLIILLAIVGVAFLLTLIVGLLTGEFKQVKALMKQAASNPKGAVGVMKQMPVAIKKQYKHARMTNAEPSMFVTEQLCVDAPYKRSLISKVWLVTFVTTVFCAFFGLFIAPVAPAEKVAEAMNAANLIPLTVFLTGGLLTLIGALISRAVYGGARKAYDSFVPAIDGEKPVADFGAQPQTEATSFDRTSEPSPVMGQYMGAEQAPETVYADAEATAFAQDAAQPFEQQTEQVYAEPAYASAEAYAEPMQAEYAEPQETPLYAEPVQPEPVIEPIVTVTPQESDEEIRRRAREEALAQARAAQEAQMAAAQAAAQAQAAQAAAQAQAAAAQAQAAAQAAQAQAAQAAQAAQGPSSADDIIARIEQIDREGAPRETMREVATLLQKERAKPENKTPEQQKKLNEALSKLLKAMSSANRK